MSFSNLMDPRAAFRVCVDSVGDGRIGGRVFGHRLTRSVSFSDIGELLVRIDAVLDKQNFPQAFQRSRTFTVREAGSPAAESLDAGMSDEEVSAARGAVSTFTLAVFSRRSASWQGQVDWLDGAGPQRFESALEFLKLTEDHVFSPH